MVKLTAKDIADEVVRQMKADKDINFRQELTPFQKTEKFLYNLKFLKGVLDVKSRKLTGLKNDPVLLQKKDLGVNVQATKKYLPEIEKIENMIENLEGERGKIQNVISSVEEALKNIEDEKYYNVITMKYFEELTFEHIAEKLNITERTAKRQKNALVKKLEVQIFSNDLIAELLNY